VKAQGGTPEPVVKIDPDKEVDFHELALLPGGAILASLHLREGDGIRAEVIDNGARRTYTDEASARDLRYAPPGYLLFRRVGENSGLWALPYVHASPDFGRARLIDAGATSYSVAGDGTLLVRADPPNLSTFAWFTHSGETTSVTSTAGGPAANVLPSFAVSAQGDRVVFVSGDQSQMRLLVRDLGTGAETALANPPGDAWARTGSAVPLSYPAWFPSGERVLYRLGAVESSQLVAQRADGGDEPRPVLTAMYGRISRDGRWLAFIEDVRGQGKLQYAAISATGALEGEKRTFPGTDKADVRTVDFSPDGTLIAYMVREPAGHGTVHLAEFPGGAARWQVATNSTTPRFARDGRSLYYFSGMRSAANRPEGRLMVTPLTLAPTVKLGVPRLLLSGEGVPFGFDTAPGGRLLIARPAAGAPANAPTRLIQNWPALLERR
jgi:Tol biopolymer transport system component